MSRRRKGSARAKRPSAPAAGSRAGLMLPILGAVVGCLLYLGGMNRTLEMASGLEALTGQEEALQRRVDRLALQRTEERRADRVVRIARERLGMVFPDRPVEILAVTPSVTRGGPTPWTYVENVLVMAVEGLQRRLSPVAHARGIALPDSGGGT